VGRGSASRTGSAAFGRRAFVAPAGRITSLSWRGPGLPARGGKGDGAVWPTYSAAGCSWLWRSVSAPVAPQRREWAHIALCRQVQGIPLALLLAAAWMATSPRRHARRVAQARAFWRQSGADVPDGSAACAPCLTGPGDC